MRSGEQRTKPRGAYARTRCDSWMLLGARSGGCHRLFFRLRLIHDLLRELAGNFLVMGELEPVRRPPLRERMEMRRILVELGLRHVGSDDLVPALLPHAQ